MRFALILALCAAPATAAAVGPEDDYGPPAPTETTKLCEEGLIWDEAEKACLPPEDSTNDQSQLMRNVRELAYAGRHADASRVLDRLAPSDPWVLTYRGFLARKAGDLAAAERHYMAALAIDPDHLSARSYLGQGYVEADEAEAAQRQLSEIRRRGGRGTWAELALRLALDRGRGFDY